MVVVVIIVHTQHDTLDERRGNKLQELRAHDRDGEM